MAGQRTKLLIDSGASLTLINQYLFNRLPKHYRQQATRPPPNLFLQLADRSQLYIQSVLSLPITIAHSTRIHTVYVVPNLWKSCIIGNDLIQKHNLQIDGGRQIAYFRHRQNKRTYEHKRASNISTNNEYILLSTERIKLPPFHAYDIAVKPKEPFNFNQQEHDTEYELISLQNVPRVANGIITPRQDMIIQIANFTNKMIMIHVGQPLAVMTQLNSSQINMIHHGTINNKNQTTNITADAEPDLNDTDLNEFQKNKIKTLIQSFRDVFTNKPGRTTTLRHQINLIPGSQPHNSPPFRYAPARRQIIEDNLKEMLDQDIIIPSHSPWASPVVLAPKKDGTLRFCIDYRKLNAMTIRDAYPIPRIDDTLDSLQEARFISTLDLRSGYWQVEMDQNSRQKTAFVTHKGLFEFKVMPYGLTNAPATFQRLMDIVLAGLKWQCCLVYIDDVIIYSPTFEQHITDLHKVFQALRHAKLTLKASKCHFCRREMRYLGHIITQAGIKPDPNLIDSVIKFPTPKRLKDLQSFLGLTGYYRRFIKNYAKIAEPLLKQLRNSINTNHHIKWNAECENSMQMLKNKLTQAPIMNTPNFEYPFILEVDACEYGLGAVLTQEYNEHKYVIAYASRTLSTAERNYAATEREALAIVWATKHFRAYIEGSKIYIRSDCKALEWMRNAKDVTGRLARWAMKLSAYQIEEIRYRPGKTTANADSLSRNPINAENGEIKPIFNIETSINLWENTNILDNIKDEQQKDPKLQPIIHSLQAEHSTESSNKRNPFILINGLLYKIKNSNRHYNQRILGNKHLLVIPKSMQIQVLQFAHDHPTAGHSGQQKTLFRLTSKVFWHSMRKDVYNYIAACQACQKYKYDNIPTNSPMQLHTVNEPWHTIGIDIMGPLPTTSRNKRFVLVIVDYFTRWVEIFPISSTTSLDITELLINQVFARYGIPKYILSDNGPQFISNLFKSFCKTLGLQQKLTANYHPQTNMTERVNRTLKPLIAIYAQRQPQSWDKNIQQIAFALRTTINQTTGETPAFLMFGRDLRGPLDLITGPLTQEPPTTTFEQKQIKEYKTQMINNLRCAYNFVIEHNEIEKINQKLKYDKHTSHRQFQINDLVWVAIPPCHIGDTSFSGKLQPRYQGPCRLTKQLSPTTFIVKRLNDNVDLGAVNCDRLKRYFQFESTSDNTAPDTITTTNDHTFRHVIPPTNTTTTILNSDRRTSNRQRRKPKLFDL